MADYEAFLLSRNDIDTSRPVLRIGGAMPSNDISTGFRTQNASTLLLNTDVINAKAVVTANLLSGGSGSGSGEAPSVQTVGQFFP